MEEESRKVVRYICGHGSGESGWMNKPYGKC
jgi:hypothetical protein